LYAEPVTLSAKGTRLNRRGRETREHLLETALHCLATGGPESVSANLIARRAELTWGTVQHQFGGVDGMWAAVLEYVADKEGPARIELPESAELGRRVEAIVDLLWASMDRPAYLAIYHLRLALPRDREELEAGFPRTAAEIAKWDRAWTTMCEQAFADLPVDPVRLSRVRSMLPGALRGLHNEQGLSSYIDVDEARRGLAGAITDYLS
jgi:AcrR family transcriptional regulator